MHECSHACHSCDSGISVLNYCHSWDKFVNTYLSHSRSSLINIHLILSRQNSAVEGKWRCNRTDAKEFFSVFILTISGFLKVIFSLNTLTFCNFRLNVLPVHICYYFECDSTIVMATLIMCNVCRSWNQYIVQNRHETKITKSNLTKSKRIGFILHSYWYPTIQWQRDRARQRERVDIIAHECVSNRECFMRVCWTCATLMCKSVYNNLSSTATHTLLLLLRWLLRQLGASVSHDISSDALHNDSCTMLRRISMRLQHLSMYYSALLPAQSLYLHIRIYKPLCHDDVSWSTVKCTYSVLFYLHGGP